MAWALAALLACTACDDGDDTQGDTPDVSVRIDGAVDATPNLDGGVPDATPDQGADAAPVDRGVDATPADQGPDAGPRPAPQRPGRLQWTGGPQGRGLPTFDYRGAGVRLRGSLTP